MDRGYFCESVSEVRETLTVKKIFKKILIKFFKKSKDINGEFAENGNLVSKKLEKGYKIRSQVERNIG